MTFVNDSAFEKFGKILVRSRGWFRSTDLWVMGPARFLCATLLIMKGGVYAFCLNCFRCNNNTRLLFNLFYFKKRFMINFLVFLLTAFHSICFFSFDQFLSFLFFSTNQVFFSQKSTLSTKKKYATSTRLIVNMGN